MVARCRLLFIHMFVSFFIYLFIYLFIVYLITLSLSQAIWLYDGIISEEQIWNYIEEIICVLI